MKILMFCDPPVGKPGHNVGGVHAVISHVREQVTTRGDSLSLITGAMLGEVPQGITAYEHLSKVADATEFDVVHIVTQTQIGFLGLRYCLERKLPFTMTYDTLIPEYLEVRHGVPLEVSYAFMRWFASAASKIVVPTNTIKKLVESHGMQRVVVNGHGVDTTMFRPASEGGYHNAETGAFFDKLKAKGPVILYVGRISPEKSPQDFLQLRLGGRPHTKVVVGGVSGPISQEELQALDPDAVFVGVKTGDDLADYYRGADAFVFPSKTDTFGLVLLEALACGTPAAAYPVIGSSDVITDSKVGCLDHSLEKAVATALTLRREDCRAFALRHTWAESIRKFQSHFTDIHRESVVNISETTAWGNMSWDALEKVVKDTANLLFGGEPSGPYDKAKRTSA